MMNREIIEEFCNALVKDKVLPLLQNNYEALHQNAKTHGAEFFNNPQSAACYKDDGKGLVSEGEVEAERLIRTAFAETFPQCTIYGEELGDEESAKAKSWTLVIDPVDGTSAMIRSIIEPQTTLGFGITLGFMQENTFIGGLIYELTATDNGHLTLGDVWSGWQGAPTTRNAKPLVPLKQEDNPTAPQTLICTAPEVMFTTPQERSAFHALEKTAKTLITARNCMGFMDAITTPNTCVIEADLSIHDVAALIPILQGAGLTVSNHQGQPIAFQGVEHEYKILTAPNAVHNAALEIYAVAANKPAQKIPAGSALNQTTSLNTQKFKPGVSA